MSERGAGDSPRRGCPPTFVNGVKCPSTFNIAICPIGE